MTGRVFGAHLCSAGEQATNPGQTAPSEWKCYLRTTTLKSAFLRKDRQYRPRPDDGIQIIGTQFHKQLPRLGIAYPLRVCGGFVAVDRFGTEAPGNQKAALRLDVHYPLVLRCPGETVGLPDSGAVYFPHRCQMPQHALQRCSVMFAGGQPNLDAGQGNFGELVPSQGGVGMREGIVPAGYVPESIISLFLIFGSTF